jgi:hypothetical protein
MQFTRLSRNQVAEWLHNAADYIEENGWWRGSYRGPNGRQACTIGGILFGNGLTKDDDELLEVREVCQAVMQVVTGANVPVVTATTEVAMWNDHAAKDRQEIIDALRKAEKIAVGGFDPDKGVPL